MILLPQNSWTIRTVRKKGRGLFATTDIEPGTIIGDYIGKVISTKDEDNYDTEGHFYLMYYHDRASIYPADISKAGAHILNHSCTPNAWMYTYRGHTLFFTIRKVFKGEELTIQYLIPPQEDDCKPCQHICKCGSVICTQSMHMSDQRYETWSKLLLEQEKATKAERIQFGKLLPLLSSYPKSLPDNLFYTLFGNLEKEAMKLDITKLPSIAQMRKLIRQYGRTLKFPKLNVHILGLQDDIIFSKPLR